MGEAVLYFLPYKMKNNKRQSGMTLIELLVVIAIMVILLGISVPTAQNLRDSFESSTSVRHLINAALGNARAMAVREQTYVGVRFQQDKDGRTYMTFVVQDKDATGLANGFRAVMGRKPMQLPEDVILSAILPAPVGQTTTFSVIFSSQGKLTIHDVRCWQAFANDNIFNNNGDEMFMSDTQDYPSVQSIIIGSKKEPTVSATEYISPYTGEIVMEYREKNP